MRNVTGEQLAQVDNPDPFASPVWRSPVYRTPEPVIWLVQLLRLLARLVWFAVRHPLTDAVAGLVAFAWLRAGWPGLAGLAGGVLAALAGLRLIRPAWFTRLVSGPARNRWRWWFYRRHWHAVMTIARLAPVYRGRVVVPLLGKVTVTGCTDRVAVRLVSGQSPADFAARAEGLAHGFRAYLCRVRSSAPGAVVLELVRRDALADPMPALPIPDVTDLRALPVGQCEDGTPFAMRLQGTHLLIAGATGAGKGSYLWGLVRAMLPAMAAGLVRIWACDPKLMELAFGRALFDRYGRHAADPADIAGLLEAAVREMQARAQRFAGKQRDHTPTPEHPFVVVLVDEIAFLTAYQADRKLKERILAALATLTTQGRAVGYCVVAALQDPRKEVLNIRNLFPDKLALRLDEPSQVDMVLGDGARDRGAFCDEISADPRTGAGVAYVRLEAAPDPVRVRAAFVSDDDIRDMTAACTAGLVAGVPALTAGEAA
ncbi:MAG TPA: FtsK/SpoIIIE domain-containing protein [Streptosporangiaceae bacterium]|nr:FtsK/SpoIIIE domain-containing protein [Streptosporangiaceae bacterium]HVB44637.1 FtsK/SpoIIIE domain-containing protein [Streptosporangiaceae bacterium]